MIALYTDFGVTGPYSGQVRAVLTRQAPMVPVIDLMADAPAYSPRPAAYLLAALAREFAVGDVILAVVDPGVGTARRPLVARVDGLWLVGPDNGLLAPVLRRAEQAEVWAIDWRPERLSATFHGRDLFAPVAAALARGEFPAATALDPAEVARPEWPEELAEIIYCDAYGNAWTGLRAAAVPAEARLAVAGLTGIARGRTFADVPPGAALWYENSSGLVEIAVNQGRADRLPGLVPGASVRWSER